jgi:hypothetical protein
MQHVVMMPVCGNKPFGPNGENEDNTFSRYTPSGELKLCITNPNLHGKIYEGQEFYVHFTALKNKEARAKVLYEAYCANVGGKAFDGKPLPDWDAFRADPAKKVQSDAWVAVASL